MTAVKRFACPGSSGFACSGVSVRRGDSTGEVIPAPPPAKPSTSFDEWFALYDAIPDNAPEEKFARLAPQPKNLTRKQRFKIIDRAHFPADFMANRRTSMPRDLDLF
jgi:hypothetical protein